MFVFYFVYFCEQKKDKNICKNVLKSFTECA